MALAIGADDKKKLYMLGALGGGLAIIWTVILNPFGIGKTPPAAVAGVEGPAMPTEGGAPAKDSAPPAQGAATSGEAPASAPPASGAGATPAGAPAQVVSIKSFRSDPFKPYFTPAIAPPPPPPPLPDPLDLPRPQDTTLAPAALPRLMGEAPASMALAQLPPVQIPQYRSRNAPRLGAPRPAGNADGGEILRSPNKRIAGVIIGDSVRALIEISTGESTITRVVQPGDEVEGIRILRIERVTENDALVTRMTVLENGQERFFDLRANPLPAAGAPQ